MNKFLTTTWFIVASTCMLTAGSGCAKSFDVEALIASNPQINALDARLNAEYKTALQAVSKPQLLRVEQRLWIADVRNKCPDAACLITQYRLRNQQLAALDRASERPAGDAKSAKSAICPVKESDLLANWTRVKGGDFEEFALSQEDGTRSFASWLHHKPEMMGIWVFKDCALSISDPYNPALSFDYRITGFANSVLQLQDVDGKGRASYRKMLTK